MLKKLCVKFFYVGWETLGEGRGEFQQGNAECGKVCGGVKYVSDIVRSDKIRLITCQ